MPNFSFSNISDLNHIHIYTYKELAERPGVACETNKKKYKQKFVKNRIFNRLCHSQASHECPQKIQLIRSSRLTGQREHLTNVLFYYIDKNQETRIPNTINYI